MIALEAVAENLGRHPKHAGQDCGRDQCVSQLFGVFLPGLPGFAACHHSGTIDSSAGCATALAAAAVARDRSDSNQLP